MAIIAAPILGIWVITRNKNISSSKGEKVVGAIEGSQDDAESKAMKIARKKGDNVITKKRVEGSTTTFIINNETDDHLGSLVVRNWKDHKIKK